MSTPELQAVASSVLRRARAQGYVVPREIRHELTEAGQEEARWKEVVELLRESLHYRQGRYYLVPPTPGAGAEQEQKLESLREALVDVLQPAGSPPRQGERRQEERIAYTRSVRVQTEDNQELMVLAQDLSPSGIRFIANRSLLGRKVRVHLSLPNENEPAVALLVRVLWTSAVAEGLYENGGAFLEMIKGGPASPAPPASP
jgi:hypothetical protein